MTKNQQFVADLIDAYAPGEPFTHADLARCFPQFAPGSRASWVESFVHRGYLQRLQPGVFTIRAFPAALLAPRPKPTGLTQGIPIDPEHRAWMAHWRKHRAWRLAQCAPGEAA